MNNILFNKSLFYRSSANCFLKRFFLSEAYKCSEAWKNRLKAPVFQKLHFDNFYFRLEQTLQSWQRIAPIDIDLYLNAISNNHSHNDVLDVLFKVRMSPETAIIPERATHAAIRWFMDNSPKEETLNVLSDRLSYGLFPCHYLSNLLLDKYLKNKDAVSAVKIAVLQMLQENFNHPITASLCLYSCYYYLESSDIWPSLKQSEPDPDEEVVKVRISYLRNPYFDDHFDLTDTNHLVGKTMWMLGKEIKGSLGLSTQLIGFILHEKFDKAYALLKEIDQIKTPIHSDALNKSKDYLSKKFKQIETESSEVKIAETSTENIDEEKSKLLQLLNNISTNDFLKQTLLTESENLIKEAVQLNEEKDIATQCQFYKQWEKEREEDIEEETKRQATIKIKEDIKKTMEELSKEEQKLFIFDREDELTLELEQKEKEMSSVVFYKEKKKKGKEMSVDGYIPPDVKTKTF